MRTGSNLFTRKDYATLSLSQARVEIGTHLVGTHLFEFDSFPKYFLIVIGSRVTIGDFEKQDKDNYNLLCIDGLSNAITLTSLRAPATKIVKMHAPGDHAREERAPGQHAPVKKAPGEHAPGENAPGENAPGERDWRFSRKNSVPNQHVYGPQIMPRSYSNPFS
ncbi:hypothetical protein AVEN_203245-1 [Araneus ventricosus]|uniref:Uncharacterized protein n=1 Tax=Araneus ventricosus TaxID=182803 RepID=A0A4Y2H4Z4_ARAVE|nr:hypothetical protein AVEN_203245-1 [Araneus ventricosus]